MRGCVRPFFGFLAGPTVRRGPSLPVAAKNDPRGPGIERWRAREQWAPRSPARLWQKPHLSSRNRSKENERWVYRLI
jgi:hypothetical protein